MGHTTDFKGSLSRPLAPMSNLIEALKIFLKYGNPDHPTHCEHDMLTICGYEQSTITSAEDVAELERLGFFYSENDDAWVSYRYGSA